MFIIERKVEKSWVRVRSVEFSSECQQQMKPPGPGDFRHAHEAYTEMCYAARNYTGGTCTYRVIKPGGKRAVYVLSSDNVDGLKRFDASIKRLKNRNNEFVGDWVENSPL